jgi:hypothetical protein
MQTTLMTVGRYGEPAPEPIPIDPVLRFLRARIDVLVPIALEA